MLPSSGEDLRKLLGSGNVGGSQRAVVCRSVDSMSPLPADRLLSAGSSVCLREYSPASRHPSLQPAPYLGSLATRSPRAKFGCSARCEHQLRAVHFRDRRCGSRLEIPRISTPQSGGRSTGGERCVKYARDSGNLAFRNQRVRLRQIRSSYRPGVGRARVSPNLRIRE
jgi:hypothetical protein